MNIEERIVQLGLNNANFEKNAKTSLKTLNDLDRGLDNFGRTGGLEKIESMLEIITGRFTAMGIAGDQVIRRLTNAVMDLVGSMGQLAKSMSIDQIGEGFSKYSQKTEAVQTIMAATAKDIGTKYADQAEQMAAVNEQLEKLNWFTDETSYSFLDMVNNIGKFTSNGRGLEESVTAMEGISTWAAISGAKVGEAGRAMYNLSQALGMGAVTTKDWMSIENANMATYEFKETAIETAEKLGVLKKVSEGVWETTAKAEKAGQKVTVAGFRESLQTKWFNSDVLLETLNQYGSFTDALNKETEKFDMTATDYLRAMDAFASGDAESFAKIAKEAGTNVDILAESVERLSAEEYELGLRAFKAAQEAKTFEDAVMATKDAVSTGWMNIFETMFGNYLEAKTFWTEVANSFYNIFAEPVNKLQIIANEAFGGSLKKNMSEFEARIIQTGHSMEDLEKVFSSMDDESVKALIEEYGSFENALRNGKIAGDLLKQVLNELGGATVEVGDHVEDLDGKIEELREVAMGVLRGDYGNGSERRKALEELGYDAELIQKIAGNLHADKNFDIKSYLSKVDPEGLVKLAEAAGYTEEQIAAMNELLEDSDALLDAINNSMSEETGGQIFREALLDLSGALEDVLGVIDKAFDTVFGDAESQGRALNAFVQRFRDFAAGLRLTDEQAERLHDSVAKVFSIIKSAGSFVGSVGRTAWSVVKGLLDIVSKLVDRLTELHFFVRLARSASNVIDGIKAGINAVKDGFVSAFEKFKSEKGAEVFERIAVSIHKFAVRILDATSKFKKFMESSSTISNISGFVENLASAFFGLVDAISQLDVGGVFDYIIDKLVWIKDLVFGAFSNIQLFGEGETIFTRLGSILQKVGDWFSQAFQKIKEALSTVTVDDILKLLGGITTAFIGFKGAGLLGAFAKKLLNPSGIENIINSVSELVDGVFDKVGDIIAQFKGKNKSIIDQFSAIAKSFAILAAGVLILAVALKIFEKVDPSKAMLPMVTAVTTLSTVLAVLSKFTKSKQMLATAVSLLIVANALLVLGAAMLLFNFVKSDAVINMAVALTAVSLALGLLANYADPGPILAAAGALLLVANAMLVLSVAMAILSVFHAEKAILPMIVMLAAMSVALAVLADYVKNPVNMLAAAAAILILSGAMLVISAAIGILALAVSLNENVIVAFLGMLLGMCLALAALSAVGPVILAVGGALLLLGVGILAASAGMLVLAVAMKMFSKIQIDPDYFLSLGGALIALGIAGVIFGLGGVGLLLGGAGLLVLAVALNVMNGVTIGPDRLISWGGALIALGVAGVIFGVGAAGLILGGAGMILLAIALKTMNGVTVGPDYLFALGGALLSLGIGGLVLGVGAVGLILGGVGLMTLATGLLIMGSVTISPDYLLQLAVGLSAIGLAGTILVLGVPGLLLGAPAIAALAAAMAMFVPVLGTFDSISKDDIVTFLTSLGAAVLGLTGLGAVATVFAAGFAVLGAAVDLAGDGLQRAGEGMINMVTALGMIPDDAAAKVGQLGSALGKAILSDLNSATSAMQKMYNAMMNVANNMSISNAWHIDGYNISAGIANGIVSGAYLSTNAISALAAAIEQRLRSEMGIASPSKVMSGLGMYISEGLGEGIQNGSSYVEDGMVTALLPIYAMMQNVADEDFSISPRITPVVDMSNVDSASGYMSGALNDSYNVSANMSQSVSRRMADIERLASTMNESAGQTINGDQITFNIYASEGMDEEAIADAVMNRMSNRLSRRGVAFG